MFGHREKVDRENGFNEAAAMTPHEQPQREPPGVNVHWLPFVETGQELGEHEALESLQVARRMHARAVDAVRHSERLLVDATDALTEARARVRRMAERS